MSALPLRIGPITPEGFAVVRSGFRWLQPDGALCRVNEPIAYCNVGVVPDASRRQEPQPLADEHRDLQVVLAPRVGGRLRHAAQASRGGFLDQLQFMPWDGCTVIATLDAVTPPEPAPATENPGLLRMMVVANRRMTELAENRSGLATGWHERSRAWWGEGNEPVGTLLSMTTCEQNGLLRGAASGFFELFSGAYGPAQVVLAQEEPLAPCARVLAEQISRTPEERWAIAEDMVRGFGSGESVPQPSDWLFMGALATALHRTAILDSTTLLTRAGLRKAAPPAVLLTSLNAEFLDVARHKRLGYTLACHDFRLQQSGPGVGQWLRANFVRVRRTLDDIRRDYLSLIRLLKATTGARLIVINAHSAPAHEDVSHYADFSPPLSATLSSVRAKELDLMLHDLAREHPLDILDVDAALARIGVRDHMPDGTHWSGRLQAELRNELLAILRSRDIPGFATR